MADEHIVKLKESKLQEKPVTKDMSEADLQHNVIEFLRYNNYYAVKVVSANTSGIPDILACINGVFCGIEVKKEDGKLSDLQEWNLSQINSCKGSTFVIKPSTYFGFKEIILRGLIK